MTHDEAIESLINSCNQYTKIVEQLQKENAFLADTIEKHNLGKYISERRSLLAENEQCKRDTDIAIRKANKIRSEYESKISEADNRLANAKRKQADIDSYIDVEADKRIESIKLNYQNYIKINDEKLKKHIAENDAVLQKEKDKFYSKNKKLLITTIISILFGIISLLTHFLFRQ